MRWTGHAARVREINAYRTSVSKPEVKRLLGTPRGSYEDG